jgi:RNA polymerase sigma factor (sigma-70 family)
MLSVSEERRLGERIAKGDIEARNALVEANMAMVVSIAKKYQKRCPHLDLMDLVQEGTIGLLRSANKFNPRLGKFSTIAFRTIHYYIQDALRKKCFKLNAQNETTVFGAKGFANFPGQYRDKQGLALLDEKRIFLRSMLKNLDARKQEMVLMHFGLTDGEEYSFEEIGKKFRISKQGAEQIITNAMRKMRSLCATTSEL